MKKILFIAVCCLLFCGCGNKLQIGNDLRIIESDGEYSIKGSFSNPKKNCGIYDVSFKLQNGDIIKYYDTTITVLVDADIYQFSKNINDESLNSIYNLEDYTVKIDSIKCSS